MPDEIHSTGRDCSPAHATEMPGNLLGTAVVSVHTGFHEGRHDYRVLFGEPLRIDVLEGEEGATRCVYTFGPGARFGLHLWRRTVSGAIQWRCFVCEVAPPTRELDIVPYVTPRVRVLLHTKGAAQSRLFLAWLADLEGRDIDLLHCPRETFEAAHFRLQGSRADATPPQRLSGRL